MPPPRRGRRAACPSFFEGCPLLGERRPPERWCASATASALGPRRRGQGESILSGGMFQLVVDDEIALVLAEERHAQAMTDLIARNQDRLARWEPWAEQRATTESTRAYIHAALEDFVRGRQISTIIALERGTRRRPAEAAGTLPSGRRPCHRWPAP